MWNWGWTPFITQKLSNNREQRVQGSAFGLLLLLIYINDLPDGITSLCKIFADDNSLFSKVLNVDKSVIELNADLEEINQWVINGKCNLTLIPINKQMKLFVLGSLFHIAYLILPLNLMKE